MKTQNFKTVEEQEQYVDDLKHLIMRRLKECEIDIFDDYMTPYALAEIAIDQFNIDDHGRCALIETADCYESL